MQTIGPRGGMNWAILAVQGAIFHESVGSACRAMMGA
jgi:hypothetical protein